MLKKIARKILDGEIKKYEERLDENRKDYHDIVDKYNDKCSEALKLTKEKRDMLDKMTDLEKRVEIMEQYYKLDEEPSDEAKTKIRTDLKIHDLEMQLLNQRQTVVPYPIYCPSYIPWRY